MSDRVVEVARQAHRDHWRMSGDEGTGDRLAKLVTDTWQARVMAEDHHRFAVEVRIAPNLRERIDVVDVTDGVAYELKVSPNNAHFEFYRDIFKVVVARDSGLTQLKRFVFLVPSAAGKKLLANMGGAIVADAPKIGLIIEVVAL